MTQSRHNSRSPFFAESRWPKLPLLRDTEPESSKSGIRVGAMHSTAGTEMAVILSHRPAVVTTTRPQAKICLRKISVTSLKSQGRNQSV